MTARRLGPLATAAALAATCACNDAATSAAAAPPAGSAAIAAAHAPPAGSTAVAAPAPLAGSAAIAAAPPAGSAAAIAAPAPPHVIVMDQPKIDLPRQEAFTLIGAGHGKRAPLRYTLAEVRVALFAQTTLSSRHLENNAFTAPVALPATRVGFALELAAKPRGQLALHGLPAEAAATAPGAEAYLAPWRSLLQDRKITVAIDERGQFTTIGFPDDPRAARNAAAKDELVQRLASMIVPLPAEPIGPGASWRVVTILRQGPAYAKQTATYTLTSASRAGWKFHVKLQRVAEDQAIADPSLPAGTTAELVAMFRQLEGDVEVDPRQPLITGGSLAIESRLDVKLQAASQRPVEQMFEDTGTVVFSRCPPAPGPARPAHRFGDCPAGGAP